MHLRSLYCAEVENRKEQALIRHEGRYWVLRSKRSGRVLGKHPTKRKAEKQELAIRLSKLRAQGRIPKRKRRRR